MSRLPDIHHLFQSKTNTVPQIVDRRAPIVVFVTSIIILIVFGISVVKIKDYLQSKIASAHHTSTQPIPKDVRAATAPAAIQEDPFLSSVSSSILGNSDDVGTAETFSTPTPYPIVTLTPLPVVTPFPVTAYTSSPTCTGTPTVDNSQVYVSPNSTQVNTTATISVALSDCNNTIAPVSDTLTIALVSGDYTTKINGSSAPVTIETKDGKVSFSVTSSNATTATFLITDTTRSFTVTTPGYHNPSVTFTNGSATAGSGNTRCTTSAGAPNTWYSDVYPNPPITTTTGSVGIQVVIRDCFKNTTSVDDALTISLASGDSDTKINGNSLPYTLSAQNGVANFTVTSSVNGTVTLIVTDTAGGFTITDPNNHNPSITFSGSSAPAATPTVTAEATPTPPSADTPAPTAGATPSPTESVTPTPSTTPG